MQAGRRCPAGGEVVYAGDGYSDRCAALAADRVFATGTSRDYLDERDIRFATLTDFRALALDVDVARS